MKQSFAEQLVPSAEQVLETMFFTWVEASEVQAGRPGCEISSTVEFQGPPDGELCVGFRTETAAALASSFLGVDPEEVSAADCGQIAEELANMICGSVLSRCAPQSSFHLRVTQAPACGRVCDSCVSVQLPEGRLNICARVDRS